MGVKEILARMAANPPSRSARKVAPRVGARVALPVRAPCAHEGPVVESCKSCGNKEDRHVRACLHPTSDRDTCTRASLGGPVQGCDRCPDYAPPPAGPSAGAAPAESEPTPHAPAAALRWVSTADLTADSIRLAALLPRDVVGIVGLPRSGLIPASVIACHLHLPLYELTHDGRLNRLGHGSRGRIMGFRYPEGVETQSGRLAVVDDTVYSGQAMRRARAVMAQLGRPAVYAAVYSRLRALPDSAGAADVYAAALPTPHLLEWNAANNGPFYGHSGPTGAPYYKDGIAVDLDGIIVHDEYSGGKIGEAYLVPRTHPCRLIVTGRPERTRSVTEGQLRALGVRWDRLEMLPDTEPETKYSIAAHKAKHYAASTCGFFFESDPVQAELIARMSSRPVVCPRLGKVWDGNVGDRGGRAVSVGSTPDAPAPLMPLSAVDAVFKPLVGKRVALVESPTTGNAGDRLIERATRQLLTRYGIDFSVREPDDPGSADTIVLFGGGNYGHVDCAVEAERRSAALATGRPCVLLPQTAYGREFTDGFTAAFVRDRESLAFVPGAVLMPDLALCYTPERPLPAVRYNLGEFFIRGREGLHKTRGVDPRYQFRDGRDYLDFIGAHAELHTDSAHVAICGLIARRKVVLYPTALHKQRGLYDAWLRDLGCEWGEK